MTALPVPCVWVVASHRRMRNLTGHPQHYTMVDEAGQRTLLNMGVQPVCYPRAPRESLGQLLDTVDGVLLGGSDTNVHPGLYGEAPARTEFEYDHERDALARPLIRLAVARGIPVLGVCRGSHDINVAFGGSLHQWLRGKPGAVKHWEDDDENVEQQYEERHAVTCVPGGRLARLTGMERFPVSSLHSQGVKVLGEGLAAEAHADDGLVEAFSVRDAATFAWGFQFHPEWGWRWHPAYGRIMEAYVSACRARSAQRAERIAAATSAKPAPRSPSVT